MATNFDIAHIYGTNRRCLSSPAKKRGFFAVERSTHSKCWVSNLLAKVCTGFSCKTNASLQGSLGS